MHADTAYTEHRVSVAARILADRAEAEDVVQDAFARLAVQPPGKVLDARGWLVVVVRRLSLDRLGSARRLSSPVADPVPVAAAPDPADQMTLDDEVRHAFGVLIGRLTPPRTVRPGHKWASSRVYGAVPGRSRPDRFRYAVPGRRPVYGRARCTPSASWTVPRWDCRRDHARLDDG